MPLFARSSAAAEPAKAVVPVEGSPFPGQLVAADSERFTFSAGKESKQLNIGELVAWGNPRPVGGGALVLLSDGGRLAAAHVPAEQEILREVTQFTAGTLHIPSRTLGLVTLPKADVRGIVVSLPAVLEDRDRLIARIRAADAEDDLVLLTNGDELGGEIQKWEGLTLHLDSSVGPVGIDIQRVSALIFADSDEADAAEPHLLVGLRDGSLLRAEKLSLSEQSLQFTLAGSRRVSVTGGTQLVFVQPIGYGVQYLSDLPVSDYRHVPYLTATWPLGIDRNVSGSRLSSDGRQFVKGLGMHSASRAAYVLPGTFRRFAAQLALDDSAGERGSVVFRVFTNSGSEWKAAYTSPVVRGGDPPLPVDVDLQDVRGLVLIVDFADRGDELDRANWLDARLVP